MLSHSGDHLLLTKHWIVVCVVLSLSYNRPGYVLMKARKMPHITQWCLFMNDPDVTQMILQPFAMTFAEFIRLEWFRESCSSQINRHTFGIATPSAVFAMCLRRLLVLVSTLNGNNNIMETDLDLHINIPHTLKSQ